MKILKRLIATLTLGQLLLCAAPACAGVAQAPSPERARAVGTLERLAVEEGQLVLHLKSDAGTRVVVKTTASTSYRRVAPGSTSLEGSTPAAPSDLKPGDRVMASGTRGDAECIVLARAVVVMSGSDLAAERERERLAWEGGVTATVTSIDTEARVITAAVRGREPVRIHVPEKTPVRRFHAGGLTYESARPSTLSDIKPGDRLRARGRRGEAGAEFTAEAVVSGTYRTFFATVKKAPGPDGLAQLAAAGDGRPQDVLITRSTTVRALPSDLASLATGGGLPNFRAAADKLPERSAADLKPGTSVLVTAVYDDPTGSWAAVTILTDAAPLAGLGLGPGASGLGFGKP